MPQSTVRLLVRWCQALAIESLQKGTAMRLMNVCPFKVGDVVRYMYDSRETLVHRIEWSSYRELWHLHWSSDDGIENYWVVDPEDPDHSGIRLVKRGEE